MPGQDKISSSSNNKKDPKGTSLAKCHVKMKPLNTALSHAAPRADSTTSSQHTSWLSQKAGAELLSSNQQDCLTKVQVALSTDNAPDRHLLQLGLRCYHNSYSHPSLLIVASTTVQLPTLVYN